VERPRGYGPTGSRALDGGKEPASRLVVAPGVRPAWPEVLTDGGDDEWQGAKPAANDYDKAFEVTMMGETHTFDRF
jgi:hypothetical protein